MELDEKTPAEKLELQNHDRRKANDLGKCPMRAH